MTLREKLDWSSEPVYLIDGSSFIYRAFYAFPELSRSDGFPTNALFILLRILLRLRNRENPAYCAFVIDGKEPTFRNAIYPEYKAHRLLMPESLSQQIPPIMEGMRRLGLPCYTASEGETDDYIASLAARVRPDHPVVIVGSDKDLLQCLDRDVVLWDPGTREEKITTLEDFRRENGIEPGQWPDYLALTGDKSDNIPGVPGIGPKTAKKLLQRFGGISELLERMDEVEDKLRKKLENNREALELSRRLTGLRSDFLADHSADTLRSDPPDTQGLTELFQQYELKSLMGEIQSDEPDTGAEAAKTHMQARSSASEPADFSGATLGLAEAPEEGGFLIGTEEDEFLTEKTPAELAPALARAKRVYLPSYKALLESDVSWSALDTDRILDICLATHLLDPDQRNTSWQRLLETHLSGLGLHRDNQGLSALRLGTDFEERLDQAGLLLVLRTLEQPLASILVAMQERGVKIDMEAFRAFLEDVQNELEELTKSVYSLAGERFNLRSSQQVARILFTELGLSPVRKTPSGTPSTSSEVLEGLRNQHAIVPKILRYRSLEKLRSTYLDPLPRLVDDEYRLHSRFNQMNTATGRLSSSEPNLQNIPIRGEFGPRMRSCFVPEAGNTLVAADYSQIELRVLAHFSGDSTLIEAFTGGEDIHAKTAGLILEKGTGEISSDERRQAKTINFGLIYGMGPQKLARETGITVKEAKEFIRIYFSKLEGVSSLFESIQKGAREAGYVTTLFGRRRLLPDINSRNENLAQQSRRLAINTVIQGSAADIIKKAMLLVADDEALARLDARLILQVHDELLAEVPSEGAQQAGERLAGIMSGVADLEVPLTVEWGLGENWAKAH
ncbi:MAG: DNA polymerase [Desulfohalobiaceae bacterium]